MRDNHDGSPEILDAYEREGNYFGIVRVSINNVSKDFEFGINLDAYHALRRILTMRPFEQGPGIKYRYFSVPSAKRSDDPSKCETAVRVEQGNRSKQFHVNAPEPLISNLLWFFKLKDFEDAKHLREVHSVNI